MDLLISAVTGLHKLCDSNPSFVPGNYTTFNDHTTMSNAMANVLTRLDAIISKVTDLAGALKGEKEKVSTHAKDTVVDIITPTEIEMLDRTLTRGFGVQKNERIKVNQIDSLKSEGKIIQQASGNEEN